VERAMDKIKREHWELHLKTCEVCAAAKRDMERAAGLGISRAYLSKLETGDIPERIEIAVKLLLEKYRL